MNPRSPWRSPEVIGKLVVVIASAIVNLLLRFLSRCTRKDRHPDDPCRRDKDNNKPD